MSFRIVYPDSNGKAIMVSPNPDLPIDFVIQKDIPYGVTYTIIHDSKLPDDTHQYFNAWDYHPENGVVINTTNLKKIHHDKFRRARKPLLDALDVEFMKASETGDQTQINTIKQQKQTLRDVTQIPIDADTIEDIIKVWPDCLGASPF